VEAITSIAFLEGGSIMKRITVFLVAVTILVSIVVFTAIASCRATAQEAAAIFVTEIPPGYRDWKVVSVAHEAGDLNDIRAILGNDVAINAYRAGTLPFPEGAIVGRIAWSYVPSEENNKTFGQPQSFVAGTPTDSYLQFMVKDSKKYAATGGWGYSSFNKDGKPSPESAMKTCFPCHQAVNDRDFIFTRYTP
jgi:Cytochrome P460